MASNMIRQTRFSTGEVDVELYKRTDIESYLSAAQSLRNCEVGTTSLVKKRKGSRLLLDATDYITPNSQIYEFRDKNNNFYLFLTSDLKFTIFKINVDGSLTFTQSLPTAYPDYVLKEIDTTLDNDVLILAHPSFAPRRVFVQSYDPLIFQIEVINIFPLPAKDFGTVNYNNLAALFTSDAKRFSLILTGATVKDFSGLTTGPKPVSIWIGGQVIAPGSSPDQPLGYGIIDAVKLTINEAQPFKSTVEFSGNVSSRFASNNDMPVLGSQFSIKQPAWSDTFGWPAKVLYYQNRLWFANTLTQPTTIFGSRLNQPINFDVGVANDADAIIYTLGQNDTGGIIWLNAGNQLEIYTEKFEFAAPQDQNSGLTPSTFSIRQQSAHGVSTIIKPTNYLNDSYYVNYTGNSILNYHYDGIGQTYTSSNISLHCQHLVKNPTDSALLRGSFTNQDNFIYYLNSDQTMFCFQFSSDSKLAALTPAFFDVKYIDDNNEDGYLKTTIPIVNIASINNNIYMIKGFNTSLSTSEYYVNQQNLKYVNQQGKFYVTGNPTYRYMIEVLDNNSRIDSFQSKRLLENGNIKGLELYNGFYVQVVYNGQDVGEWPVVDGQCFVDNPNRFSGNVQVGFLYDVKITPMYIFAGSNNTNSYKKIKRIFVDYYNSLNFYVNGKLVEYQSFANIRNNLPLSPQTDTVEISSMQGWDRFSTFTITQSAPFDLQVTGVSYQISAAII